RFGHFSFSRFRSHQHICMVQSVDRHFGYASLTVAGNLIKALFSDHFREPGDVLPHIRVNAPAICQIVIIANGFLFITWYILYCHIPLPPTNFYNNYEIVETRKVTVCMLCAETVCKSVKRALWLPSSN